MVREDGGDPPPIPMRGEHNGSGAGPCPADLYSNRVLTYRRFLMYNSARRYVTVHRVSLTARHFDLARRYMVAERLPHVRAAVEKMIEDAAYDEEVEQTGPPNGEGTKGRKAMIGGAQALPERSTA